MTTPPRRDPATLDAGPNELGQGGDHEGLLFAGTHLTDVAAPRSRFDECLLDGVVAEGGTWRGSSLRDVEWRDGRVVGLDLSATEWLDVTVTGAVFAGVEAYDADLRRVTFRGCKLDGVNLRGATLRQVVFDGCLLRDIDLGGAELIDVAFPGSAVRDARLERARLSRTDLRGTTELEIVAGVGSLGGATVTSAQLMALAPLLAHDLGLLVED